MVNATFMTWVRVRYVVAIGTPCAVQGRIGQISSSHDRWIGIGNIVVGIDVDKRPEVCADKRYALECGVREVCALQVGARKVCASKVRIMELGLSRRHICKDCR